MAADLVLQHGAPVEDWRAARRHGIGASEIATVLGLSPHDSPLGLYWRKRGEIPDTAESAAMEWGTRLEPVVADAFADRHPEFELRVAGTYRHPKRGWQTASPDRLVYEGGGSDPVAALEIKTARLGAPGWGRDGSSDLPDHYLLQVQQQLDVLDLDTAYVAVLIGGQDYREYEISRDGELCDSIAQAGDEFWRRVHTGTEPVADFSDATSDALAARYPAAEPDTETVLPPAAHDLLQQYRTALAEEKAAARRKTEATNRLKQLLGDAEVGLLDSRPAVAWSNSERRTVTDLDRLAATHPEHVTVTRSRRLTVKGPA